MKALSRYLPLLLACCAASAAAQVPAARQDHALLRQTVEQFLQIQTAGLPGQVRINVGQVDSRLALAACAAPEAFLPGSSRAWGKTTVGVRCSAPAPWTVYIPATVSVTGEYIVTAAPLAQGQMVGPNDIAVMRGDLTALPQGIVTNAAQAVGRTLAASLQPGMPLRQDSLRAQKAVQQGQMVRLVSNGPGFSISAEAQAITNAMEGQVAQARTQSGQVVSGIARTGGVVEVTY
jgi:flagella basal body P-ring formation protein FlgA